MRNSDWSSDVCSSDLQFPNIRLGGVGARDEFDGAIERGTLGGRSDFQTSATAPADTNGAAFFQNTQGLPQHWQAYVVAIHQFPRGPKAFAFAPLPRSEEHTSELQSLMRTSYAG